MGCCLKSQNSASRSSREIDSGRASRVHMGTVNMHGEETAQAKTEEEL